MPDPVAKADPTIVPDADFYRAKAAQFLRLAALPNAHHDRETLLELALKLQAMACAMDNEPLSAAEVRSMLVGR